MSIEKRLTELLKAETSVLHPDDAAGLASTIVDGIPELRPSPCEDINPELVPYVLDAARLVIDSWTSGDLAEAVRSLASALEDAKA